jgi:hypothetical protein
MATQMESKSLATVMRNLNKEIKKIEGRSMEGLVDAAVIIRADMDKTPPLIPVDTGHLRNSWTAQPIHGLKGPALLIGFTIEYALFVHEMYGANFQRPGAGAGFFVASLKRNKQNILEVIRKAAQID